MKAQPLIQSKHRSAASARGKRLRLLSRTRGAVLLACAAAFVGLWFGSRSQDFVERYSEIFAPVVNGWLSRITGQLEFSLAEVMLAGFLLWLLIRATYGLVCVLRGKQRLVRALLSGLLRVLGVLAPIGVLFYALWGLHYARAPLAERLGWSAAAKEELVAEEVEALARELIELVNGLYAELHGGPEPGPPPGRTAHGLERVLDDAYARVAERLGLGGAFASSRGPAKPVLASGLMSTLGLTGFYFPWSGEANFNRDVPRWQQVHALAHEKSHQRGVAREDEAEFLGFLACAASSDDYVRYCGYLFAQRRILRALALIDRERALALVKLRHEGVQADVDEARRFWERHQGLGTNLSEAINDSYLRMHRVPGGIASYGRAAALLVLWARSRGGRLTW